MRKVALFSLLLILGLFASQWLPLALGAAYAPVSRALLVLTMIALAFIMIHVGYEFELDKSNLRQYGRDYLVAFTAASFPWLFVTLYFVYVMLPPEFWSSFQAWKEALLVGRFASPTSAGVLFSMLAAAGLSATWMFKKAGILAISLSYGIGGPVLTVAMLSLALNLLLTGLFILAVKKLMQTSPAAALYPHLVRRPAS